MTKYNEETLKDSKYQPLKDKSVKRVVGGTLEDWEIVPFYGNPRRMVVRGTITNDSNWNGPGYEKQGPLRTSLIVEINDDQTELETLNTIYKLGKPREVPKSESEL